MPSTSFLPGLSQEETDHLLPYLSHKDLTRLSLTTPQNHSFFTQDHSKFRKRTLARFSSLGISNMELEIFELYCVQKGVRINHTVLYRHLVQLAENLNYVSPDIKQQIKNKENRLLILFCCSNDEKLAQLLPETDPKLIIQIALLAGSGAFIQKAIPTHKLALDVSAVLQAALYNQPLAKELLLFFQKSIDAKSILRAIFQLQNQLDEKALEFIGHLLEKMEIDWQKATDNFNTDELSRPESAVQIFITEGNILVARFIMELYKKNNLLVNDHVKLVYFCSHDSRSLAQTRLLVIDYPPVAIARNLFPNRELLYRGLHSQANTMMDYLLSNPEESFPNSCHMLDLEEIREVLERNTCLGEYGRGYNIEEINSLLTMPLYTLDLNTKLTLLDIQKLAHVLSLVDYKTLGKQILNSELFHTQILNEEQMMMRVLIEAIQANNRELIEELLPIPIVKELLSSQRFLIYLLDVIKVKESNFTLCKLVLSQMSIKAKTITVANSEYLFSGRNPRSILENKELLEFCINELYTTNGLLLRDSQEIMALIFQSVLSKLPMTTKSTLYLIHYMGKISDTAPFLLADAETETLIHQNFPTLLKGALNPRHPALDFAWFLLHLKQVNGQPIVLSHQLDEIINDSGLKQSALSMQALWKQYVEQGTVLNETLKKAFKGSAHYFMEELLDLFKQAPESKETFKQPLLDLFDDYTDASTITLNETQAIMELRTAICEDSLEPSLDGSPGLSK
ncbi:MAG: hypothetical protein P4L79_14080 [Legionella sp.]|uniref:hypothetical protein n=1 Tax=Legionella sp. TaxID=459 RepID=UPI00284526D3|nr:hypothetical protein [Legionella sp.]